MFKTFNKTLSEQLTSLINLSFIKWVFPNVLKTAQVLPTFKKGDKTEMNNYSPISLISNVSEILQKLMYKRLYTFLEESNSFYPYQFGFRLNHSTNSALIEITEQILKVFDKGLFAYGVYLDLKRFWHSKPQHTTNKTGTLWYKRKCQLLALLIPSRQETIYKCNRKRFKLPRNYSWSSARACSRTSAIYYIYQWFKSISNIK